MADTESVFDGFALLGDDEEFDVDKIFGSGSDEPAPASSRANVGRRSQAPV